MCRQISYWSVGHATDTTETGMHMARDYLMAEWAGHPGQRFAEEQILREWCRAEYGPEVAYVQGVAACRGWTLSQTTKDKYVKAAPITWGGRKTATRRIHLLVGRKVHSQPAVSVVSEDDALKPAPPRCDKCGQLLPTPAESA